MKEVPINVSDFMANERMTKEKNEKKARRVVCVLELVWLQRKPLTVRNSSHVSMLYY